MEKDIELNLQYAAKIIAGKLLEYMCSDAVVVAVPKGGVPVGYDVSQDLQLPLELMLCRRIQHPGNYDESIGSVSIDEVIIDETAQGIPQDYICHQIALMKNVLMSERRLYCGNSKPLSLRNKVVILVDDFLKSGNSLLACLKSIKKQEPAKVVIAIPIATQEGIEQIAQYADNMIILTTIDDPFVLEDVQRNLPSVTVNDVRSLFNKAHPQAHGKGLSERFTES